MTPAQARRRLTSRIGVVEVHTQPIVRLPDGEPVMHEMLARWRSPSGRLVGPAELVPGAESDGTIAALDYEMLTRAVSLLHNPEREPLTVNMSAVTASHRETIAFIDRLRLEHGPLPSGRLVLEITETAPFTDLECVYAVAAAARQLGAAIALDDFGTGYGTLHYLGLRPDIIKIDGEFAGGCTGDAHSRFIVERVCGLAHALGAQCVAEHIEDAVTAEALAELGVELGQGYLYGPAAPLIRGLSTY